MRQDEHHKRKTFQDEYLAILKNFGIVFKDQYLFGFFRVNLIISRRAVKEMIILFLELGFSYFACFVKIARPSFGKTIVMIS